MKIVVDAKPLLSKRTGIGRYTYHVIKECLRLDHRHQFFLCGVIRKIQDSCLTSSQDEGRYERLIQSISMGLKVPFPFRKIVRIATNVYFPMAMRKVGAQLFWGTNYFGVFGKEFKTVITIHDMAHEYYPQYIHPVMVKDLSRKLRDHAHRADMILTVSEHTKTDIVKFLGVPQEKIRVVHHGVDSSFRPAKDTEGLSRVRQIYALPERFLLFVGMLEPRKNVVGLLRAFASLCKDAGFAHALVIAGAKGWNYHGIFKAVRDLGIGQRVVFTGYVPDEDLCAFYNMADVFVYPSFYEGFGLPVLEAMACGTPVVTSIVSCLPEIGGDAPRYVDPTNMDETAFAIKSVLEDSGLRKRMRESGLARARHYSWEVAARQTLAVFADVATPKPALARMS